jgi:hypothetical protein
MASKKRKAVAPVEKDRAAEHALMTYRRAWAADVVGLAPLATAELDPEPLEICDLNGEPLFYEFSAMDGKQQVGRLKASADKRLGAPVVTVELGARKWDAGKGIRQAKEQAQELFPKARIEDTDLVCYSYPKIGVRVDLVTESGEQTSLIFDVADGSHITRFGADELEGQTAWSVLDAVSPRRVEENVTLWDLRDRERDAAQKETPKLFARGYTTEETIKLKETLLVPSPYLYLPFISSRVLRFAPRCSAHQPCFELYAQQTDVYCAVATGQMILDFYRYHYDQDDIAAAMGTGAGGTSNTGQVAGYESLSNNCLDATYDGTADWTEAKTEIDANRPVKSGVPGHARACAGWKRQNIWLVGQQPQRWLRIYDPWPWNADICDGGAVYWEDWDAVTHTNFISVRHRSTPCS